MWYDNLQILGYAYATVYYVETSNPELKNLRRYSETDCVITHDGIDVRVEDCKALEEKFQTVRMTNLENQLN